MNKLPQAIADYIAAANAQEPDRVAACFTADATVHDENAVRRGHDEIAAWAADTGARYGATMEPVGIENTEGRHRLRAAVRGRFPGSPITLTFDFRLQAGRIHSLEIAP